MLKVSIQYYYSFFICVIRHNLATQAALETNSFTLKLRKHKTNKTVLSCGPEEKLRKIGILVFILK